MPDSDSITLATPIQFAKGVGERRAAEFLSLGIRTCGDLLFHLPRDYLHYTDEAPVNAIQPGDMATLRGTLLQTRLIRQKPRRFEALLEDASGTEGGRCRLTWFNSYDLHKKLLPGMMLRVTGKVTLFRNQPQIVQAKYEILDEKDADAVAPKTARIEPVYGATVEMPSPVIARVIGGILDALLPLVNEWFAPAHLKERNLLARREAMRLIHRPEALNQTITARRSLAYHEFFLHQTAVALKRYHQRNSIRAVRLRVDDAVDRRIRALLPFQLTAAQTRVIESLRHDLDSTKPMNRLLQGDVGSGKTVVALYAMLSAVATRSENAPSGTPKPEFVGHQAALMAPTEILAEQHYITLLNFLAGKKVKIALLTGSVTGAERRETLARIADGSIGLIVGTHALLSEAVRFNALALVVIDEQHKFGVEQRSIIRTKTAESGVAPHTLVMTATPIPRTLAMTAFGDLDVSVIDELPPGRQKIFTRMTPSTNRDEVYPWIAKRLKGGEQAYVVVPAIDEDPADPQVSTESPTAGPPLPSLTLRTAVGVQQELQADWLKDYRVALIHGRMNRETRQHIMERFRQKIIDVLVATTVIEVGVDVPNASIMVIEHADRFGLSQLHQLRGRVGRGDRQSYCILLADQTTDESITRLQALVKYSSGFHIAEADLKLRGMGQLIGTAQSGRSDLHFPEFLLDPILLPLSRRDAFNMIAADPRLLDHAHKPLRTELQSRYADTITLADVG